MEVNNVDFCFLAEKYGNLTAVMAIIEADNPDLQYEVKVLDDHFSVWVLINHHSVRLTIPNHGSKGKVEERFLDKPGIHWGPWEKVCSEEKYHGAIHREKDILCALTHDFIKKVWGGIIQANQPADES